MRAPNTIHYFHNIDSTNRHLRALAADGAPAGTVVLADFQSAGLGRHGRTWHAPAGTSLLMSILFRPNWPVEQASWLTMIAGLAATDAIERCTSLTAALKWPNDIMLPASSGEWRKSGGILQEGQLSGDRVDSVIVGMGLNVNVTADALQFGDAPVAATSLQIEAGRVIDRLALFDTVLQRLRHHYALAEAGQSPQPAWHARLMTLGQVVQVRGRVTLDGVAEDTDEWGHLIVRDAAGTRHTVAAGDVTLRAERSD